MADLLARGAAWLAAMQKKHATREVIYRRSSDSVAVPATIGRTVFEQDDGAGAIIRSQVRDYLIATSNLVLSDEPVLPKSGDRIEETDAGKTFVYEVMSIGKEPAWRYSDPYRNTLRIHTKHVATHEG